MRVVNLTPHVVTVVDERSRVIRRWPGAVRPARVEAVRVPVGLEVAGVPLMAEKRTRADLPEPQEGVWFIVSSVVVSAHPERRDLLVPSDLVRDGSGVVTACRSFVVSGSPVRVGGRAQDRPVPGGRPVSA
ncbi:hypothetical protein A6A08_24180 [Nocardiopsis sp. TSRI0078]|uniref:hypothetical protein n=1 Tax=unclassified Nocardiopsis TaxID=2649073 RepID=UPI00093F39FA|nr:hypothetical protein [Nocardiopsis sp. TSRI0078]OKI19995.1 hypothetical protein A6A08_24180 [Nocardiopsis sp. TSRI0078]